MVALREATAEIIASQEELHRKVDEVELAIANHGAVDLPLRHHFAPGIYMREIFMQKGAFLTSKIHATEHFYFISHGTVAVVNIADGSSLILQAPYNGRTIPGTRRVLYIIEDCVWFTIHHTEYADKVLSGEMTEADAVRAIEESILFPRENQLLSCHS